MEELRDQLTVLRQMLGTAISAEVLEQLALLDRLALKQQDDQVRILERDLRLIADREATDDLLAASERLDGEMRNQGR